jgi:hypothetical protein
MSLENAQVKMKTESMDEEKKFVSANLSYFMIFGEIEL